MSHKKFMHFDILIFFLTFFHTDIHPYLMIFQSISQIMRFLLAFLQCSYEIQNTNHDNNQYFIFYMNTQIIILMILFYISHSTCNYTSCSVCSGNNCAVCQPYSNRILQKVNYTCICKDGYYDQGTIVCQACHYTCKTCSYYYNCTTCDTLSNNRILVAETCQCPQGYFDNGNIVCRPCNPLCLTCYTTNFCSSCNYSLHLYLNFTQCSCYRGYYLNSSNICASCNPRCLSCSNANTCDSCNIYYNRIYSNSQCVCVSGTYENQAGNCVSNPDLTALIVVIVISVIGFIILNAIIIYWYFKIYKPNIQGQMEVTVENHIDTEQRIQKLNQDAYDDKELCSICLDSGITLMTSCKHQYHPQCIVSWCLTKKKKKCPNCLQQKFSLFSLCKKCLRFTERISICRSECKKENHVECFLKKMEQTNPCKNCKNQNQISISK